ncbi:MAG: hypothetical protein D4R64_01055 [Porphyromonadaceae bacterium]|nr:MAG: hypothetical protein D4R64_01055 [Porphyromonadaceae bacterium]
MWVNLIRIKNLIESTYQRTQNLALQAIQTVFPSDFSVGKSVLNRIFGIFSKWAPDQLYVREISFQKSSLIRVDSIKKFFWIFKKNLYIC